MTVNEKVTAFLARYGYMTGGPDIDSVIDGLLYDMQRSLDRECGSSSVDGSEPMIPTWTNPPSGTPAGRSVIVIDAGGTNFRSCLVTFDSKGVPAVSCLEKTSMPGIEREYSKKEFFDAIAENLEHLKNKADTIGFCFSYAMQILPDGDGKVIEFSKEIQAEEVVGSCVGKSLSDALVEHGWKRPAKIILLNDTTAALLAGAVSVSAGRKYDSFVGFILGTGMNSAYIECGPIGKIAHTGDAKLKSQIVVCEVGSYNRVAQSVFDVEVDNASRFKGRFLIEKMCSGAYLGPAASSAVRHACKDGLFSKQFADAFTPVGHFELMDMDKFLYAPYDSTTKLGAVAAAGTAEDYDILYMICDAIIERSARLASAVIAAAVIKSGKGSHPCMPVCVLCNGTTFHKTHNLKPRIMGYLNRVLTEERHLYYDIVSMDNDITFGTAVAALPSKN